MKRLIWVMVLGLLGACTSVGGGGERYWLNSGAHLGMDPAVSLLHYANYARNLSAAERERELERQRGVHMRDKSDFRRLQHALLLSTPDASANDRRLAQQLIDPLLEGRHDSDLQALAGLVNSHLNGYKRADELERKLDAVKDIERSLLRREKGKP